ncbi:MAG: hypothetical protein HYR64_08830 [Fimbriimonas ginsengisoli]|uniref:DUF1579 domain-containing protein n=1 Tax=Fimbriimonas ginsengisoli TaxID=1005039 RepID=A0A931LVW1_FIMGI|nr:hypothetical protein [Fimbriimonas ginsengisoli]
MDKDRSIRVPTAELAKLEFLVGDFTGIETLYPPGNGDPITLRSIISGEWDSRDRFMRLHFLGIIPDRIYRSQLWIITAREAGDYGLWIFANDDHEPGMATGTIEDGSIVFTGQPRETEWGLQRFRFRYTREGTDTFSCLGEIWHPAGYRLFQSASYRRESP